MNSHYLTFTKWKITQIFKMMYKKIMIRNGRRNFVHIIYTSDHSPTFIHIFFSSPVLFPIIIFPSLFAPNFTHFTENNDKMVLPICIFFSFFNLYLRIYIIILWECNTLFSTHEYHKCTFVKYTAEECVFFYCSRLKS